MRSRWIKRHSRKKPANACWKTPDCPYYRDRFGFRRGDYPVAEAAYDRLVSLPLYPRMTDADVDRVAEAVRAIIAEAQRHQTPAAAAE